MKCRVSAPVNNQLGPVIDQFTLYFFLIKYKVCKKNIKVLYRPFFRRKWSLTAARSFTGAVYGTSSMQPA